MTAAASLTNGRNGYAKPNGKYRDIAEERRRDHHAADIVIIGAGIVGCTLAVALGNQGRSVLLLEKSLAEPNRIVGELLQPDGVLALEKLGLKHCLEGIDAVKVLGYNVIYHGEPVKIPYPNVSKDQQFEGRCFHHGRFIMNLREAARSNPNVTIIETTAVSLVQSTHGNDILGVECLTKGEKDFFFAPLTVAADGYNSFVRKQNTTRTSTFKSKFWGLELIDAEFPVPNYGHVLLSNIPPVLIYQIGTHETRALVDIPMDLPSASVQNGGVKNHLRNVVLPTLPKSFQPAFEAAIEKGGFKSMPNSFLPPTTNTRPGLMFLGDSLNMRHPLTGGGMTVAFNDVVMIRQLLSPEHVPSFSDSRLVLKQLSKFHWKRKGSSSVINILAQALYTLFAADNPYLTILQRGCFRYFQLGMIDGPVSLLAGLTRQPLILFRHFYAVAFLSIWVLVSSAPLYMLPLTIFQGFMVFVTACQVIFPFIWAELRS